MMVSSIPEAINLLEQELRNRGLPVKYSSDNIVTKCPICYYKDGKEKIKLYIHKESGVYHCFRCGSRGSFLGLVKLLQKYYNIDLTQYIPVDTIIRKSFSGSSKFLSSQLESIDRESAISIINSIKKDNKTLKEVYQATNETNLKVTKQVYGYLLKRNISPILISQFKYPYFIGTNPQSRLYMRFGLLSFFYTNYEARAITNIGNNSSRYIQSTYSQPFDFIFLPQRKSKSILSEPIINQLLLYHNPESYIETEIVIDELYIVEGLFDTIKLNMYLNKSAMSLGGWNKYKQLLIFIKLISTLFRKLTINKLILIFDNDIPDETILNTSQGILMYRSYFNDIVNEFKFAKFNPPRPYTSYKDIGDCKDAEELKLCLVNTLK